MPGADCAPRTPQSMQLHRLRHALWALLLAGIAACGGGSGASADGATSAGLSAKDISLLMPIPPPGLERLLVGLGDGAILMPVGLFDAVVDHGAQAPGLDVDAYRQVIGSYPSWRIVSARFDPCFISDVKTQLPCLPFMRLVAQPVLGASGKVTIGNAAFHLIYQLGDPVAVAKALDAIRAMSRTGSDRLGVHPGLSAEFATGGGPVTNAVADLIRRNCMSSALVSINLAASVDVNETTETFFAAFFPNKETKKFAPISPQAVGAPHQTITFTPGATLIAPASLVLDAFSANEVGAVSVGGQLSADALSNMLGRGDRVDNPRLHTLGSTDCVSCHVSTQVQVRAKAAFTASGSTRMTQDLFTMLGNQPARDADAKDAMIRSFRNFGWMTDEAGVNRPSIAQRTANETALKLPLVQELLLERTSVVGQRHWQVHAAGKE